MHKTLFDLITEHFDSKKHRVEVTLASGKFEYLDAPEFLKSGDADCAIHGPTQNDYAVIPVAAIAMLRIFDRPAPRRKREAGLPPR